MDQEGAAALMQTSTQTRLVIQGTADWNQPIATNQHYVVRELAKEYDVYFIESLGLRRPELKLRDLKRIFKRMVPARAGTETFRPRPPRVTIISPKIIPIHTSPWTILNLFLMKRTAPKQNSGENRIYWTFSPVTYGLELSASKTIYHCVDLLGEFPGIDRDLIHASERRLAAKGAIAIGSSEVVVKHLKRQGFQSVLYWKNVADTEVIFSRMERAESNIRQGALFAGNLSDKKIDFGLLTNLVNQGTELHLAGPIAEGGGESRRLVESLIRGGAKYHGILSLEDLADLMSTCLVGLIPYQLNSYTSGVSPLKTYEYMSAGLPVVATMLPGVEPVEGHVFVANSHDQFEKKTQEWLRAGSKEGAKERQAMARLNSWTERGQQCRSLVHESGNSTHLS